MVTSSVKVIGGIYPMVSVKTYKPVKKTDVLNVLSKIKNTKIKAPIEIGDIIIDDITGEDFALVATRRVKSMN